MADLTRANKPRPEPMAQKAKNPTTPKNMTITHITSKRRASLLEWKEIMQYRDLLYHLSLRELKLRYKQTSLGVAWVILQPLAPAVIFAILFGNFAKLPSNGQPYLLMVFTGLIPWTLFSAAVGRGGGSLVANSNLLSKIYFPRIIIPLATVSPILLDGLVSLAVLAALMAFFGITIGYQLLAAPFFLACALVMGIGMTLVVASLNVYYRDIGFAVPFVLQLWNYLTPVIYSSELIPPHLRVLYSLNPTVGLVEGFRWSILGGEPITQLMLISMLAGLIGSVVAGMIIFQKIERGFADIV